MLNSKIKKQVFEKSFIYLISTGSEAFTLFVTVGIQLLFAKNMLKTESII